jgi:hypothetical protein
MQKKIFLQRNIRKGGAATGSPYLKYLVFAAVCLVFLVIVTSYVFNGKSKDITKRPVPDRATVTKEVPKALEPVAMQPEEKTRTAEPVKPSEDEKPPETTTAPEALKPVEAQHPAKPPELDANLAVSQKAASEALSPPEPAPAVEAGPKDLFPKKGSPPTAVTPSAMPAPTPPAVKQPAAIPLAASTKAPPKPGGKTAALRPAVKPSAPAGKGDYAVQVGTVFKTKPEAETVRKDLSKKGYAMVIRPAKKGPGYSVTTKPTGASKAYTLQEQMKIQGVSTTKVIKVGPVPGPAKKSAPKESNTEGLQNPYPGSASD